MCIDPLRVFSYDPTWLNLVHTVGADLDERVADVVGRGSAHRTVKIKALALRYSPPPHQEIRADRPTLPPAGLVFDPRADGQGGDHDAQMGLDRLADVVIDGPGLQAMLGHSETLLDAPQLVILIDDELRGHRGEVGGVSTRPALEFWPPAAG
jgi:hypothetical protein